MTLSTSPNRTFRTFVRNLAISIGRFGRQEETFLYVCTTWKGESTVFQRQNLEIRRAALEKKSAAVPLLAKSRKGPLRGPSRDRASVCAILKCNNPPPPLALEAIECAPMD